MALTCQNCGSTDIVTIQGQNYCINCGQMVKGYASQKSEPDSVPVATVASEAIKEIKVDTKKIKAKAVKAKMPATPKVVNPPKMAAPAIISHIAPTPYETKKVGQPTIIEPNGDTDRILDQPAKVPAKPVHELKPFKPRTLKHDKRPESTNSKPKPTEEALNLKEAPKAEHFEDIKPHPASFTIKIASMVAVPVGVMTATLVWLNVNQDIAWYLMFGAVVLFGITSLLSQAALLYGLSRNQDGRPTQPQRWWAAARSGFLEVINADLLTLIALVLLAFGWLGMAKVGGMLATQPGVVQLAAIGLGNGLLAWLTLGALAARHIAIPAVVIGGISSTKGVKLGWQAYLRAGGHLVLALIETLIARLATILALVILALVIGTYATGLGLPIIALLSGIGAAITVASLFALLLQIEVRVWLKQYRYWVNAYFPEQKLRLLSGRTHSNGRR